MYGGLILLILDFCLWIVDWGLWVVNWKVWIVDCGLWIIDFGLMGMDCGYVLLLVMKVLLIVVMMLIDEYFGKCLIYNLIKLLMFVYSFLFYLLKYLKWMWLKKRIGCRLEGLEMSVL